MILLVEDYIPLQKTLHDALCYHGFEVIAFDRAQPARSWLQTHASKLRAIVCDYDLPDGTGAQLLAEAKCLAPQALRCLISGYIPPQASRRDHIFLPKPFRLQRLLSILPPSLG